jgi:flavodoxin
MKICIIYHSETGNTRHVAQHLASACDGKLIEICDRASYNRLTRFLVWCKMARGEEKTEIEPTSIDVSGYDLIVFGSPVWAFKPTPVIHTAIGLLKGCEGKKAMAYSTHGGRPGQTNETFTRWIESRNMKMAGVMDIHQKDIENEKVTKSMVAQMLKAGGAV